VSNKETIEEKYQCSRNFLWKELMVNLSKFQKYINAIIYIGKALAVIDFETINIIKLNNVNVDINVNLIIN
jgi:hypothetical protein